ncbi:thiamine biosynthesis lipoprotein [Sphingobium sp. AP50]|uniref:FAD:protein FMN transferase n=1 Tax=Sphingobium sp. AP50 TaxID=1884369 RepID=UPI0008BBA042|nr:FAD:protein FMN transferase [Sphingobium sp. AP50]SEJ32503.1 thiamine biosynthesis lipoprotein [Sphingobium sp. AP50]
MGTSWSAQVVDPPAGCLTAIEAVLARIIEQMSNWEPDSVISRFNRLTVGEWMPIPDEMRTVLAAGLEMARLSSGAFDPAIGRLVDQWGFGPGTQSVSETIPAPWTRIEIDGWRARRLADVTLDFSGIAKGFAVDAVATELRALGVVHFLVEIGGELRGDGIRPDFQPWWVDVEAPPDLIVPTLRVALCDLAIATSGDYRRFRLADESRLSHSIDPATGAPIAQGVASVTVLHEQTMMADAWATAITVMGPDKGMKLATRHDLAARLVLRTSAGAQEYMTPRLAAMLA